MIIKDIKIKKILNSLGEYTIECIMEDESGLTSVSSVPQGKSAGVSEAVMHSADTVITNFNTVKGKLINAPFNSQKDFDEFLINLDGTSNKQNLGGNLTLVLSICFLKLLAKELDIPTYTYIANTFNFTQKIPEYYLLIFEGGKHGSALITAQEYMLIVNDINEAISIIKEVKRYLDANKLFVGYGLEGAFTSNSLTDLDVLKLLKMLFPDKKIAIDIAQSSREGEAFNFNEILNNFNIYSIEDPAGETEFGVWGEFYKTFSQKILVVGDDLTTTNFALINKANSQKLINAIIIKPNQIGTVYETLKAVKLCNQLNLKVIVSHRGGDTNDDFIADLSVGVGADFVKFGGLQRGERIAKYNRLEEIRELGR